jgi:hypothetical protein
LIDVGNSKSTVELLSVHVPKTGGTAFRTVLEHVYGPDRIHTVYPEASDSGTGELEDERWLADSLALSRLRGEGPRVVHGHYLLTWYADRFPRAARIAWLRHPVDRIASFYYMWREMDLWPTASPLQRAVREGRLDLVGFAGSPAMRDQVTTRFLGDPRGRGLTFIGLQERFDEDLERLGELLEWPAVSARRSNVNESSAYADRSVADDTRDRIARLNPADMGLYEAVLNGRWKPIRSRKAARTPRLHRESLV